MDVSHPALPLAAVLFGIGGASFSGILSVSKASMQAEISDLVVSRWFVVARPIIGALGALAAYALLVSGILALGDLSPGLVLAGAVAAGFSERLVVRALSGFRADKA